MRVFVLTRRVWLRAGRVHSFLAGLWGVACVAMALFLAGSIAVLVLNALAIIGRVAEMALRAVGLW